MKRLLFLITFPLLIGLACTKTAQSSIPQPLASSPLPVEVGTSIQITSIPQSLENQGIVCTGFPGGKLHIRDCAAETCNAVGYLEEGQLVTINGSEDAWRKLNRPINGWANGKFICEIK